MQVSMPSARTSTFRMPSASISSLSQQMTVRSSIVAFSMGTSSSSRPSVMTKPPTCWLRVAGKADDLLDQADGLFQARAVGVEADLAHPRSISGPVFDQDPQIWDDSAPTARPRQAHGLADLAHGALAAIVDDRGAQARAVAAVAFVDVLDHLLAPLVFEIHVDVGRLVAGLGDETLEDHGADLGRDAGHAQRVAGDGIGRRAAPLAEDAARPGEGDDVVHGQEIGLVASFAIRRSSWSSCFCARSGMPSG
jgi:hypothetical protein